MNGENGYVTKWILVGTFAAICVLLLPACCRRLLPLLILAISLGAAGVESPLLAASISAASSTATAPLATAPLAPP